MRTNLIAVLFLAGCQNQIFAVTLQNDTDTVVPAGLDPDAPLDTSQLGDLLGFYIDPTQLAEQGINEDDITQLSLVGLTLSALAPEGADMGFLTHLETWVTSPNEGDAKLFEYDGFSPGQTQFTIPVPAVDLTPWVFDDSFEVKSFVDGVAPLEDTTLRAHIQIRVGTSLYGVWDHLDQVR